MMDTTESDLKIRRDRDLFFAILLVAGSIALIFYSFRISLHAMETTDAHFYTAPGFSVMFVGICLFILAIVLFFTAIKAGAGLSWLAPMKVFYRLRQRPALATVLIFAYLYFYMVLLWESVPYLNVHVPYWLNTFIFLLLMMFSFKAAKPLYIILISALTAGFMEFVFKYMANIPLP